MVAASYKRGRVESAGPRREEGGGERIAMGKRDRRMVADAG